MNCVVSGYFDPFEFVLESKDSILVLENVLSEMFMNSFIKWPVRDGSSNLRLYYVFVV